MDFVAFDIEMPTQKICAISAIGVTVVRDNKIVKRYYSLVNPETTFSKYVIELIGITPEMVRDAPTLPAVWAEIGEYFTGAGTIVAHGAHGDLLTLVSALRRYKIEWPGEINYLCTCDMTLAINPEFEHHSLDFLCDQFEIPLSHHNAQSDSDGCALLLIKYLENGLDESKHIKTVSAEHFIERQSLRLISDRIKQRKRNAIKEIARTSEQSFDYERQFYRFFKEFADATRAETIKEGLVREINVFGVDERKIVELAQSLDETKLKNLMPQKIFACYEMYRLYVYAFNRMSELAKNFLNLLAFLPDYCALDGININRAVRAVYSKDADPLIIADELSKANCFGYDALAVRILIREAAKEEPDIDKILDILKRILVYRRVNDEIMVDECIDMLNDLILNGCNDKVKKLPLPKKLRKRLEFLN